MNHLPTQRPLLLTVPPSGYVARYGDRWPTHKAKGRRKQANSAREWREEK